MIEQDTIRLLRECDAGIKMGVSAINDVLEYTENHELKSALLKSLEEHEKIKNNLLELLNEYHDDGKEPSAMAKGMSWIKTNVKLAVNESDDVVADLITDGCNMGVKSLYKYLNQYKSADEKSKNMAKKLISIEENLMANMRKFL
ncbi:MAG: hypothetical protein SPE43_02955 [Ruminococcus sp.]|nr:hypothetical protein [Oscillospiraceae bacterium]MDY4413323.1 hypothetical protein [Ruminococcus sp.]